MSRLSPLKITPPKRQRLMTDWKKCVICQKEQKESLSVATPTGMKTILEAAKKRSDGVTNRLPELNEGPPTEAWLYHRNCYKSFSSRKNLSHVQKERSTSSSDENKENILTRQKRPKLADCSTCIICHSRKKAALHQMKTISSESTFRSAAKARNDVKMMSEIECVDLVATGAVYHGSCMASYTSSDHLSRPAKGDQPTDPYQAAFSKLIEEIDAPIKNGHAFTMKKLVERFKSLLPADTHPDTYRAEKLQNRLQKYYGDAIVFQSQRGQGKSSVLISSNITLRDAIQALTELKEEMSPENMEMGDQTNAQGFDETATLHAAMGILRREIAAISPLAEYPTSSEVGLEASEKFVPSLLSQAILWLLDARSFESADEIAHKPADAVWRRVLSLCESLIYSSRPQITPLHLGLAAQLHHDHGKRNIIDQLNSHGFCISYDELRRFTTAVGQCEMEKETEDVYIPHGLIHRQQGGNLIQEGADNVDINCETIDGKGTFHSMARVVFQVQPTDKASATQRTPLGRSKSLAVSSATNNEIIPYQKPLRRPEPPRSKDASSRLKKLQTSETVTTETNDILWVLLRALSRFDRDVLPAVYLPDDIQPIPFWTGFNSTLAKKVNTRTIAAYAPIIDAKPAEPSTVYTTMVRCKQMTNQLGQLYSIQTMDQQLYAIAQQVKWNTNEVDGTLQEHILRLGGFHGVCAFIATIGKLWGDGGLRSLLVESDVYAACTADMMLEGKQFHRAVRGLTLAYEALMQLFLTEFLQWCDTSEKTIPQTVWMHLNMVINATKGVNQAQAVDKLRTEISEQILPLIAEFRRLGCETSPTFHYWVMFLDAVQILLSNIRAEREGGWPLHLATQLAMVPYYFATNRVNYARWAPVYLLDMTQLPSEVADAFNDGQFAIRRTANPFNGVWSDLGTETTVIRDAKGDGGVIGLTRKQPALTRWLLTRHIMGEYGSAMEERSGRTSSNDSTAHEQTQPAAMKRDNEHAKTMIHHLEECMTHPFKMDDHPDKLVNIASGMVASTEVQESLLQSVAMGKKKMDDFVEGTLSSAGHRSLYSPIPRTNLKTFSDLTKKTRVILHGKTKDVNMNSELVFRRALKIAQLRPDVNIKTVLSCPITSVPTALFHEDGAMRKTSKAELLHLLEAKVASDVQPSAPASHSPRPECSVYIRDAMAELQSMKVDNCRTFDDLATSYMSRVLGCTKYAITVVDVFDQYDNVDSIKAEERNRRMSAMKTARQYQVTGSRTIPPWQKFMALPANKVALTDFLCTYMKTHAPATDVMTTDPRRRLFLAGGFTDGSLTCCISKDGSSDASDLSSTQEEADSRMLLHACHADKEFLTAGVTGNITIKSPDTDVLVLAVHYFAKMTNTKTLWLEMGKVTSATDQRRSIPVHQILQQLHPSIPPVLPAVHALTGCDSTSALYGMGKKKAVKLVEKLAAAGDLPPLHLLGKDDTGAVAAARKLIAMLYDPNGKHKEHHGDLNGMRAQLATLKDVALNKLPPSESSFIQHVERASFQTRIWISSHIAKPDIPSPVDHGWVKEDDELVPLFFEGKTSSQMLDDLLCTCRGRKQCQEDCSCAKNRITCTEHCLCKAGDNCRNEHTDHATEVHTESTG